MNDGGSDHKYVAVGRTSASTITKNYYQKPGKYLSITQNFTTHPNGNSNLSLHATVAEFH